MKLIDKKRIAAVTLGLTATAAVYGEGNTRLDSLEVQDLQGIVVTGQSAHQRVATGQLGSEKLELDKMKLVPQLFGETDIIKSITLLPGVHGEAEGAGGFEVRGGNAYQNLVTVDGMTVYNPAHLMGIFSTFNDDAMSRATLHKGPVPAEFGGASSSVLETYMRPGDMNRYNFSGTIGILNAKVAAGGPIVKDKLSFAVAGRRSYFDLFLKMIPKYRKTVLNFYDINAKIRYRIDSDNILDASFFFARDNMAISRLMSAKWGNIAGSINWSTSRGDNWKFRTTGTVTNYSTDMGMDFMDVNQSMKGYIRSFSLNEEAEYAFNENHSLDFGLRSELQSVMSGDAMLGNTRSRDLHSGWQNAVWASYLGHFGNIVTLNAGIRASFFSVVKGNGLSDFQAFDEERPDFSGKTYFNLEPRLSIKVDINSCHNLKAGYSMSTQNVHGLRTTSTSFPFDRYTLTTAAIRPEETSQYSIGYAGMTPNGAWDWSAEVYYKSMRNVYDYDDGMSMFSKMNMQSMISGGKGRSYGLELMLRKNTGKLTGWVSYTLAKTETRIVGINDGKWYRASNDRRHDLSIVGIYTFNKKWNVSASWTFSTGKPLTAPDAKYELAGNTAYYFSARNSYITPASHRLDLSATYTYHGKRNTSIVSFGFFNVYNHYSPFVIFFEDDPSKPSGTRAVQQALFGIVPSLSYTIKF